MNVLKKERKALFRAELEIAGRLSTEGSLVRSLSGLYDVNN
jgi:hypothetical protein